MTLDEYARELDRQYRTGVAREHSYRPALQNLLASRLPALTVTNEPARIDCGAPDFILSRDGLPVAFVEAKDIGDADLDGRHQHREQFDRYRHALPHIVFTDYLDFHLYEDGEFVAAVRVADIARGRIVPLRDASGAFDALLARLTGGAVAAITSAQRLATVLAGKARLLADTVGKALKEDGADDTGRQLRGLYEAFRRVLIHDLTPQEFADLYAQTITYGMFAARLHDPTPDTFSRQEAATLIPKTNPFLRRFFQDIAGYDLDDRVAWMVDDLATTFRSVDLHRVLSHYGQSARRSDPMVHFYEDFLTVYDPAQRKAKGVWYTPQPVVAFIVRAVDCLLRRDFGLPDGLADASKVDHKVVVDQSTDRRTTDHLRRDSRPFHRVQILDPATGTGTFLAEVVSLVHSRFEGREGLWQQYVERDLLPRLNGFELLMVPYAIAHLKLDLLLVQTGYEHCSDRRLHVYLTNSLETANDAGLNLFDRLLSDEANAANRVKRDTPVMVMIGNPPYNGTSRNKGAWITEKMRAYKCEPGGKQALKERNPKWLNDDYVKFIRLAQHYVERTGTGVIAFINPHGYLDNPTFRGMRWRLLTVFDKIYTIDLHGNSKKKEKAPNGSKDENVFDIQQGVSINFFVRTQEKHKAGHLASVYHYDLYGTRDMKFGFLDQTDLDQIPWERLSPRPDMYYFVPKDFNLEEEYKKGFSVKELFKENSVGIVTTKDKFLICDTPEEVRRHISDLIGESEATLYERYQLTGTRDWSIQRAKADVGDTVDESKIVQISYRPFDDRWVYYTGTTNGILAWPRYHSMRHLLVPGNFALLTCRQQATSETWSHVSISNHIVENCKISSLTKECGYVFPLFIENNPGEAGSKFLEKPEPELVPNLNPDVVGRIEAALGEQAEPMELFDYVYAVLHSPRYRERYREMLRTDFPRVPYPRSAPAYHRLAALGAELRRTHLMEGAAGWPEGLTYPVGGTNEVDAPHWADGRVYVNATQYVGGIGREVWEMAVGGYQPAQKWLKDRQGRTLTNGDVAHYARLADALARTLRLMARIDGEDDFLPPTGETIQEPAS